MDGSSEVKGSIVRGSAYVAIPRFIVNDGAAGI